MAHPDDCEILAGGTLCLLGEKGWDIHVVSMTPGDCGSMEQGPEDIAATRRQEGQRGAQILGGTYHCLESRDLYITFDERTIRRAVSLTRRIAPTIVFTHSLVDYMLDHEQTARIARTATFGYAVPNTCPGPIPPGSMVPYLYYADPVEGVDVYGERIEPSAFVNVSSTMKTKTRALRAHASQRQWLLKHHGMDQYVKSMQDWGRQRGGEFPGGPVRYAEGFRQHKGHPYPRDCVLARELGGLVAPAEEAHGE